MSKLTTIDGYSMFDVVSAMQKCIRRGHEIQAVWWAQQLESRYRQYLWKRLVTIAHEEVGLADPQVVVFVETCRKHYFDMIEQGYYLSLPLINAVVALCRAKKSRMADHLFIILYSEGYGEGKDRPEIPDFAYDVHTSRGKAMGRSWEHFYDEAATIHPEHPDPSLHQYESLARETGLKKWLKKWVQQLEETVRKNKKNSPDCDPPDEAADQPSLFK